MILKETTGSQDHAKFGVTMGRVVLVSSEVTCGVISLGWPAFSLAAKARGWRLECIVLMHNK
jgi:hypothetical protein